jgi:DNA-binding NtrC family response regulator
VLEVEHLSLTTAAEDAEAVEAAGNRDPEPAGGGVPLPAAFPPPGVDLAQWEKAMIEQALREAGGNQTRAAQRLGISRDTLRYRLKKFGIQG